MEEYPARFHKQLELMWVRSNSLDVSIDGKDYTMYPGDIYVVFPNIIHSLKSADAEGLLVIADDDLFNTYHDVLSHFKPETPVLRKGTFPDIVYSLFERAEKIRKKAFSQTCNVLTGYVSAAVGELINSTKLVERSTDSNFVQQLIFYLLDNYTEEITLDDVARDLNYNKYYISHIVSETFKCNFRVLVNSYRISMAQNLLVSTEKNISEIAYECGFKNQSSFNRIFLKHCGVTPSDFRNKPREIPERPTIYEKNVDSKKQ